MTRNYRYFDYQYCKTEEWFRTMDRCRGVYAGMIRKKSLKNPTKPTTLIATPTVDVVATTAPGTRYSGAVHLLWFPFLITTSQLCVIVDYNTADYSCSRSQTFCTAFRSGGLRDYSSSPLYTAERWTSFRLWWKSLTVVTSTFLAYKFSVRFGSFGHRGDLAGEVRLDLLDRCFLLLVLSHCCDTVIRAKL